MDGVVPYRLEMQAKAAVSGWKNLYDFWGDSLYREVIDDPKGLASRRSRTIVNLASKEYSRCIEKHIRPNDQYITCVFGELEEKKVVQKGVYAKMARGEMVRFMAGIQAETPEQIKAFNWSGYHYDQERSSDREFVFIRTEVSEKGKKEQAQDGGRTSAADEQKICPAEAKAESKNLGVDVRGLPETGCREPAR